MLSLSQQTLTRSITHDGIQRDYILYVPANYNGNSAVPLVFNFHGYGSNATGQMWYGDFRDIADTAGFMVIHPQGTYFDGKRHFNVGGWTIGSTTDDVGFTDALIDTIVANYPIDLNRIYSTGMSNGGYMSFLLACQLSDKIAAVASVTGSMTPQTFTPCSPTHPTPILQIHGTSDNVVPYNGANWTKSIDQVLQYWINYNNCSSAASTTAIENTDTGDGSTAELFVYSGGDNQSRVEHIKISGGTHTWPGTSNSNSGANQDFNASLEIWKFFSQYDLNGLRGSATSIDPREQLDLKLYPNPARSNLIIEIETTKSLPYKLINISGKLIYEGMIFFRKQEIDLSELEASLYFLVIGRNTFKVMKEN